MQHDHVLKKRNFDLLPIDPIPMVGRGDVSRQNIWYCVAAIVILLNLICNMTQALDRRSHLICFILILNLSACQISVKNIDNLLL